jgi:hypothetical protein
VSVVLDSRGASDSAEDEIDSVVVSVGRDSTIVDDGVDTAADSGICACMPPVPVLIGD